MSGEENYCFSRDATVGVSDLRLVLRLGLKDLNYSPSCPFLVIVKRLKPLTALSGTVNTTVFSTFSVKRTPLQQFLLLTKPMSF